MNLQWEVNEQVAKPGVEKVKRFITSNGPSTAADIRKILGTTRRIVIPFLEQLDKEGITRREGDLRSLN